MKELKFQIIMSMIILASNQKNLGTSGLFSFNFVKSQNLITKV